MGSSLWLNSASLIGASTAKNISGLDIFMIVIGAIVLTAGIIFAAAASMIVRAEKVKVMEKQQRVKEEKWFSDGYYDNNDS